MEFVFAPVNYNEMARLIDGISYAPKPCSAKGGYWRACPQPPCIKTLGGRPRLGTHLAYNAKREAGKADPLGPGSTGHTAPLAF